MSRAKAYATHSATEDLGPLSERRESGLEMSISKSHTRDACHSDIHQARNEWGNSMYPMVPHEIVGRARSVGSEVTKFKAGQRVGVGCLVDSCRSCASCNEGLEQYCENGWLGSHNSR